MKKKHLAAIYSAGMLAMAAKMARDGLFQKTLELDGPERIKSIYCTASILLTWPLLKISDIALVLEQSKSKEET